ncbi:glycoside hydrolase family 27 protein [Exidia glandulosa HHB12029]|uniref:Alpha-galactosidase n=1 Tax=Exidia glandulosa HHB12029 TaxID=1314781 RepID=A0A165NHZ9_EXIGL|nr:glycoside hydrolase family 27 protein [Exidia glandulosa HHB12029]
MNARCAALCIASAVRSWARIRDSRLPLLLFLFLFYFHMLPLFALSSLFLSARAWNNGVAKLPPMGFNTWNRFQCGINETLMRDTAQAMLDLGFLAAGYNYVNLDDCWHLQDRDADGKLQVDSSKFPSGLNALTDYLHSLGFLAGIYEDEGTATCGGFAGSLGHEETDARSFVDWGFDFAKIDNCNSGDYPGTDAQRFSQWHDALKKVQADTGKMLVYTLVKWQGFDSWYWAPQISNAWRIFDDIQPNWGRIKEIINKASFIGQYARFYAHNDLDMLEVGNGGEDLSLNEERSHFTAWAMTKSPLLLGTDLSALSKEQIEILTNPEIIAINQDDQIAAPVQPFFWGKNLDGTDDPSFPAQYWSGYFQNTSTTAIMYLNFNDNPVDLNFTFDQSPHLDPDAKYAVRDLWKHRDLGEFAQFFFDAGVDTHDVRAYLFRKV